MAESTSGVQGLGELNVIDQFKGEYGFLSNFHYSTIDLDDRLTWVHLDEPIKVPTIEHGFQAAKATTFEGMLRVANAEGPGEAKYLGRRVKLREDWGLVKNWVMKELLWEKFTQPVFQERLLDTYPHLLVEGNSWGDHYWGVSKGYGHNWLGLILMEIRNDLVEEL